jgi:hypothetical protein
MSNLPYKSGMRRSGDSLVVEVRASAPTPVSPSDLASHNDAAVQYHRSASGKLSYLARLESVH